MDETETLDVQYEVLGFEPVNSGSLLGLILAEVTICGVAVRLQGMQLRSTPAGITVEPPKFRDAKGIWRRAVCLPVAVEKALGAEVLAIYHKRAFATIV